MVYKKPASIEFHVFTNRLDELFFGEKKRQDALKLGHKWGREYGCSRVYESKRFDKFAGIFHDGDCILSIGSYPS